MFSVHGTLRILNSVVVQETVQSDVVVTKSLETDFAGNSVKGIWGTRKVFKAKQPCDQTYVLASDSFGGGGGL